MFRICRWHLSMAQISAHDPVGPDPGVPEALLLRYARNTAAPAPAPAPGPGQTWRHRSPVHARGRRKVVCGHKQMVVAETAPKFCTDVASVRTEMIRVVPNPFCWCDRKGSCTSPRKKETMPKRISETTSGMGVFYKKNWVVLCLKTEIIGIL